MNENLVLNILHNSGLEDATIKNGYIVFTDPSCIFPAFDSFFEFMWIVALVFTAFMLVGWTALYIKNGININSLFNNAKTVILIFCIFSVTKPIVDLVYGENLFAKQCDLKRISLVKVQEFMDAREQHFGQHDQNSNFEIFNVTDSGPVLSSEFSIEETSNTSNNLDIDDLYSNASNERAYGTTNSNTSRYSNTTNSVSNMRNNSPLDDETVHATSNVRTIEYRNNMTIYVLLNGERISRSGGSASWRNNNPGNIRKSEFARQNGAAGETDKWAVFPDEKTGLRAITKLLQTKNYINLSIKQAMNRWAPSSDSNNPDRYAKHVSERTGLPIDSVIKDLNDDDLMKMARAMQIIEGWTPGIEQKV
ncbi:MAG: hypothetical protein J6S57_00645 [Alphaproteobacteria bacterium]|nr:hypothetical protein [Alphaproteobacteria bacterium]